MNFTLATHGGPLYHHHHHYYHTGSAKKKFEESTNVREPNSRVAIPQAGASEMLTVIGVAISHQLKHWCGVRRLFINRATHSKITTFPFHFR